MSDALMTLSASKLKTWNGCHRQFYYSYVERKERGPKHPAALTGSSVHKAVENTFRAIKEQQEVDPVTEYELAYQEELRDNPDTPINRRSYDDGMKMIARYDFVKRVPEEVEQKFTLPFPNANNPLCYITGFMDQVFPWGVVDMKSSREKPLAGVLGFDAQFIVYNWAFEQLHGEPAKAVIWQHLRTGEDIIADVQDPYKLRGVVNAVEEIIGRDIAKELFADPAELYERNIGQPCRWCDHRLVCLGTDL